MSPQRKRNLPKIAQKERMDRVCLGTDSILLNDRVVKLESDKAAEKVILENINNFLKTFKKGE